MIFWRGSEGKDRYGILHSDDVRQMLEKAFRKFSHQVVMHEPVISSNHDVNIRLVYIINNLKKWISIIRFIELMLKFK